MLSYKFFFFFFLTSVTNNTSKTTKLDFFFFSYRSFCLIAQSSGHTCFVRLSEKLCQSSLGVNLPVESIVVVTVIATAAFEIEKVVYRRQEKGSIYESKERVNGERRGGYDSSQS